MLIDLIRHTDGRNYMVMEFMDSGNLTQFIYRCNIANYRYSEQSCRYIIYSIARGLKVMHDMNLMHRDIKGENILFGSGGKVKICDFGFSRRLTEEE